MKTILTLCAVLGLAAVIIPPILYLAESIDRVPMQRWMLAGTLLWFVLAPLRQRLTRREAD